MSLLFSSQGVCIFFFHVIFNKDVRKNLKNIFTGKKTVSDESSTTRASLLTVGEQTNTAHSYRYFTIFVINTASFVFGLGCLTNPEPADTTKSYVLSGSSSVPPSSAHAQLQQRIHRRRRAVPLRLRRVHRVPGQHAQVSQEPKQLPGLCTQVQHADWPHGCFCYSAACVCACPLQALWTFICCAASLAHRY